MTKNKKNKTERIIISEKISDLFSFKPDFNTAVKAVNPLKTLTNLISGTDGRLSVLLFVSPDAAAEIIHAAPETLRPEVFIRLAVLAAVKVPAPDLLNHPAVIYYSSGLLTPDEYSFACSRAFSCMNREHIFLGDEKKRAGEYADALHDQEDLIQIGRLLSIEKDPDRLLRTILYLSKKITGADAGSIFLVEAGEQKEEVLRFAYSHTFSREIEMEEFRMPLNRQSIAGYTAITGETLNIADVYQLDAALPIAFNSSFDRQNGYRTRSMLVVPMRNHYDKIIGVIQLINCKESHETAFVNVAYELKLNTEEDFNNFVIPFDDRYKRLLEAVAGQAAIAIENNRMLRQIEHQFEEFVKVSVSAIESRDPATKGHSQRVAKMCIKTALAVNSCAAGIFENMNFSGSSLKELEYAALLHDFGKVYIDPDIFLKSRKLYDYELENLKMRISLLYKSVQLEGVLSRSGESKMEELMSVYRKIIELNEPSINAENLDSEIAALAEKIPEYHCEDIEGRKCSLLENHELENLGIKRGSLNAEERKEIESHVRHTYNFVSRIPWPDEYKNIPEFALKHHEKLDGTGYPDGIRGDAIPLEAQMISVADIFDALSAADRPYKKALPLDKIISILKEEADKNKLNKELVELFIREACWSI
jgi:HD-GYP domain-containing protein (c-di-GMP phosphodiesterase class II)